VPARLVSRRVGTPVGDVIAIACDAGLVAVLFADPGGSGDALEAELRLRAVGGSHPILESFERELAAYFAPGLGGERRFATPVVLRGTAYQERAWEEMCRIELGRTISYGELARRVGDPDGARAAAGACGANRLAIIVPCHRVVAADGTLWGYGGGLARKAALLDHEARVTGRYQPTLFDAGRPR
jgi:O-6-methylguanine DNA methyltransferase